MTAVFCKFNYIIRKAGNKICFGARRFTSTLTMIAAVRALLSSRAKLVFSFFHDHFNVGMFTTADSCYIRKVYTRLITFTRRARIKRTRYTLSSPSGEQFTTSVMFRLRKRSVFISLSWIAVFVLVCLAIISLCLQRFLVLSLPPLCSVDVPMQANNLYNLTVCNSS